jgi:hypothetical protein
MALDPNIAMGYRGIELANPLAQYGQIAQIQNAQNQNALAQYQLGAAQRADVAAEGLNRLYAKHYDPVKGTVNQNALMAEAASTPGLASQIPKLQEAATKREQEAATLTETKSKTDERQFKLTNDKLKHGLESLTSAPTPQDAIQKLNDGVSKGFFDMKTALAEAQKLQNMPLEDYQKYRIEKILGLVDAKDKLGYMLPKTTRQDIGGSIVNIQDNPMLPGYGLPVQGMAPLAKTQTFADKTAAGNLVVNQKQLALNQENAVKPVFNAEAGGFVAPPTKASPQGTFTPLPSIQQNKDQQSAIKALKSAGYDPVTGEDTISKLIAKSTSGGLQAGSTAALAFFGKSTEGRKAIAALEGTANQIATDLAGGKLGAGISNTDRDFIVGALGDVSNPMKTSAERLAGWNAAKTRMVNAGVIPAPATAAPNIDALLNKYK